MYQQSRITPVKRAGFDEDNGYSIVERMKVASHKNADLWDVYHP